MTTTSKTVVKERKCYCSITVLKLTKVNGWFHGNTVCCARKAVRIFLSDPPGVKDFPRSEGTY